MESEGEDMSSGLKLKLTVCVWPDDTLTEKGGAIWRLGCFHSAKQSYRLIHPKRHF